MGLVQDEQRTRPKLAEQVTKARYVGLIGEQ